MKPFAKFKVSPKSRLTTLLISGAVLFGVLYKLTEPLPDVPRAHRSRVNTQEVASSSLSSSSLPSSSTPNPAKQNSNQKTTVIDDQHAYVDPGVFQNPFGPLNPQAIVGRPAQNPALLAAKAKKAAAPPPPTPSLPVPPPPLPSAPAAPQAPPLPFKFAGLMQGNAFSGGKRMAFLTNRSNTLVVSQGAVIDNVYRVDAINDTQIVFTYLPLDKQQVLPTSNH